jgi:hypothetical protein
MAIMRAARRPETVVALAISFDGDLLDRKKFDS